MRIKQTVLIMVTILALGSIFMSSNVFAAAGDKCGTETLTEGQSCCGGVVTSVVFCKQTGSCIGGENPYEGMNPKDDAAKIAEYKAYWGHDYGKCDGGVEPSKNIQSTGIWGLLIQFINILSVGIGLVAIGGVVYGSVLYTSAAGNVEQVKKARTIIANTALGIVVYALMFAFLNFVIPGGLFVP